MLLQKIINILFRKIKPNYGKSIGSGKDLELFEKFENNKRILTSVKSDGSVYKQVIITNQGIKSPEINKKFHKTEYKNYQTFENGVIRKDYYIDENREIKLNFCNEKIIYSDKKMKLKDEKVAYTRNTLVKNLYTNDYEHINYIYWKPRTFINPEIYINNSEKYDVTNKNSYYLKETEYRGIKNPKGEYSSGSSSFKVSMKKYEPIKLDFSNIKI